MSTRTIFMLIYGLPYIIGVNLLLISMAMDSRWPMPHSDILPIVGLLGATLLQAFLGVRVACRRPQLANKTSGVRRDELHWRDIVAVFKPNTVGGMFPTIGTFLTLLFGIFLFGFGGITILWAACDFSARPVFPIWLRSCMIIDALGMAAVPLLLALLCAETGIIYLIRRLYWRGPRMNKDQFARWKAANPDAPMPWERALKRSVVGNAAKATKAGKSGDRI